MSQLPPANQPPRDPNAAIPVAEPGFEVHVQDFWAKKRGAILGGLAVVLVGIIGWQGYGHFAESREAGIREVYAKAGDDTAKLSRFAADNSGHPLAGVARLRLADERYAAADYKQAATLYGQAVDALKPEVLLGRARLGVAASQLKGGDQGAAEATFKAISADGKLTVDARAEAAYHLATLALDAGKVDEARKLADEVSKIDATGPWSQRATMLLASLPSNGEPTAAQPESSVPQFKIGG